MKKQWILDFNIPKYDNWRPIVVITHELESRNIEGAVTITCTITNVTFPWFFHVLKS
jgi:hypothetical protein